MRGKNSFPTENICFSSIWFESRRNRELSSGGLDPISHLTSWLNQRGNYTFHHKLKSYQLTELDKLYLRTVSYHDKCNVNEKCWAHYIFQLKQSYGV
jgi:hypothetical protein